MTYLCRTQLRSPLTRHLVRSRPPKSPKQTTATVTTASQHPLSSQHSPKHAGTTPWKAQMQTNEHLPESEKNKPFFWGWYTGSILDFLLSSKGILALLSDPSASPFPLVSAFTTYFPRPALEDMAPIWQAELPQPPLCWEPKLSSLLPCWPVSFSPLHASPLHLIVIIPQLLTYGGHLLAQGPKRKQPPSQHHGRLVSPELWGEGTPHPPPKGLRQECEHLSPWAALPPLHPLSPWRAFSGDRSPGTGLWIFQVLFSNFLTRTCHRIKWSISQNTGFG